MKELDKVREIFIDGVDEETRQENLEVFLEWEKELREKEAYEEWKSLDLTKTLNKMVKDSYLDFAVQLADNRSLTEDQRKSIHAKQDACLFILELTDQDAKSAIDSIRREIRMRINAV